LRYLLPSPDQRYSGSVFAFRTALILIAAFLLNACAAGSVSKQNFSSPAPPPRDIWVPKWYAELPQLPGCQLVHAQSGIYVDAASQKEALLENGAANLAKSNSVLLEVGWGGSQITAYSQTADYIKEQEWEGRAQNLKADLKILKEFRLDNSMLALTGICPGQEDVEALAAGLDDTLVNISSKQPPDWVKDPLQMNGQYFGVGAAAGHITPGKAWQEAERQARADLAMRLAAQYKVLERSIEQNEFVAARNISETYAKLTLRNLQVIRHSYSRAGQTFYALVRLPAAAP